MKKGARVPSTQSTPDGPRKGETTKMTSHCLRPTPVTTHTSATVPEIVEEPPAIPALEFNFCPPPAEVTPPPATPGDNAVEERIFELQRKLQGARRYDRLPSSAVAQQRSRHRRSTFPTAVHKRVNVEPNHSEQSKAGKNVDELKRSARRELADKLVAVLDRDRSRSASRNGLERLHREVRHRFQHYTPLKKDAQPSDAPMDSEDALLILSLLGTQKAYRRLKRTLINNQFDVLPSVKKVIAIKRQICEPLLYQTVETPAGVGFFCADIERALKFRLHSAKENLKYIDPNVLLKLSGDFGQGFTKITISFGEAQRPNSPANTLRSFQQKTPAPTWRCTEGHFGNKSGSWRRWTAEGFLGGDVSFVWGIVGHCGSARTTFPSPVCTCGRDQLLDEDMCRLRSVAETQQAQQFEQAIQRGESATKALRTATIAKKCKKIYLHLKMLGSSQFTEK